MVDSINESKASEQQAGHIDHRPWGYYTILSNEIDHKVKFIYIKPSQRLSLQRHSRRTEHWFIIRGKALVTKNDQLVELGPGEAIDIPLGVWHRVQNPGSRELAFIEIQIGDYFGEDDIERREDDYGRD